MSTSGPSLNEITHLVRIEVEREMERCYNIFFDEVDRRIERVLGQGKAQPFPKVAEKTLTLQEVDMRIDRALASLKGQSLSNGGEVAKLKVQPLQKMPQQGTPSFGFKMWGQAESPRDLSYSALPHQQSVAGESPHEDMLVDEEDRPVRRPSMSQNQFVDTWLETVEAGQLDIYTCLGLSNAFTNTADTRKIWAKAISCAAMQCVVPLIMVVEEAEHGMTIYPCVGDTGFRFIGAVLYTYSVYTMYNNANCITRSELSNLMSEYDGVPIGFSLPLVAGELLNVFVAIILVVTLYQIYAHQNQPADLILNAVAVNFLGSVDAEFVNEEMKKDAIENFKQFTADLFERPNITGKDYDPDEESRIDHVIRLVLYGIAFAGLIGSIVFMTVATSTDPQVHHGMRHGGNLTSIH